MTEPQITEDKAERLQARLVQKMTIATAARFAASQRLERRSRLINLMLALLSAEVIVISVIPITFRVTEHEHKVLVMSSMCAAILILVLSLYQYSSRDDANADRCLHNATRISAIRKRLEFGVIDDVNELHVFVDEYTATLRECGINHDPSDFTRARLTTGNYTDGRVMRFLDSCWIAAKRVPAIAFISIIVALAVAYLTWINTKESGLTSQNLNYADFGGYSPSDTETPANTNMQ